MKKQLIATGFIFLLVSLVILSGCLGGKTNIPSESDRFVGTWGEMYGSEITGNVTFYSNGTGVAYSSNSFPESFNYSVSNGKITVIQPGQEDSPSIFDYFFSDNYSTLNIKNIYEMVTIYKKQ